jgi:DNA-binding response OmpR family regulator
MPSLKRVLLVDDDEMLRASLAEQFATEGNFEPIEAGSYREGLEKGLDGLYEFMVLDVSLPDGDGRALCREFRDHGVTCPVIILTASDSDADTIEGLKAGANDYITKPFRFAVLMARVDAHLRSHGTSEEAIYRIGPYTFRPSAKVLVEGQKRIRLTEKETNILNIFSGPVPRSAATYCSTRFGATTRQFRRIPWRHIFTVCVRRSRKILPGHNC